jgi:hypothetical protein
MLLPFSPHNPRCMYSVARYKRGAFVLTTDNCKINQNAPTLREVHKFSVSVTLKSTFSNRCTSWELQTHRAGLQDFITVSIPRKSPEACGVAKLNKTLLYSKLPFKLVLSMLSTDHSHLAPCTTRGEEK